MPKYSYVASDIKGKKVKGVIEGEDENQIYFLLKEKDLYLIRCEETVLKMRFKKMKSKDLSDFCRKLGTMLNSGIPLIKSIAIMLQGDVSKKNRPSIEELSSALKEGVSLSEAMKKQKKTYPDLLINMIKAGESSGNIDQTILKMAEYFEKERKLKGKIKSATAYPIILLILTFFVLVAIFVFILPSFFAMFESMEVLPLPTRIVLGISNFTQQRWYILLVGLVVFLFLFYYLIKIENVRIFVDKIKIRMPGIGKSLRIIYTARFSRTLSSLYSSGLPMIQAIQSSVTTVGNKYIVQQFSEVIRKVRSGQALSVAMKDVEGFDNKLSATINVGEETGKLDDMLTSTAESYEYESDEALNKLVNILQPLLIIILAVVIGFVMISVLLPILSMYQTLDTY